VKAGIIVAALADLWAHPEKDTSADHPDMSVLLCMARVPAPTSSLLGLVFFSAALKFAASSGKNYLAPS
jgi:hypothetical protein